MKVLYICVVLFPLLAYAKPSLKMELLSRLLQALDKRDNGYARYDTRYLYSDADTTAASQGITAPSQDSTAASQGTTAPSQDPTTASQGPTVASRDPTIASQSSTVASRDPTTASQSSTVASRDPTTASHGSTPDSLHSTTHVLDSTADDTGLTTDNHLTSSSEQVVTPLPMSPAPKDNPRLPPLGKDDLPLTPEEYIRHVTQGMCVMLAYVRGKEESEKGSDEDNSVRKTDNQRKSHKKTESDKSHKKTESDESHKKTESDDFPWVKVERLLQQLCDVVDDYNSEPMKLAEAFVKQMAEHKGDNKGVSRSRSKTIFD